MQKYWIVLFKDKKKVKIIKKYVSLSKAEQFFRNIIIKSENVLFEVKFENGIPVEYEIGLIDSGYQSYSPTYKIDDLGRSLRVKLLDENMNILKLTYFKKEEFLYDLQKNKRILSSDFVKSYMSGKNLKILSALNNKLVLQEDEKFSLFSLKNESDTLRFIGNLERSFMSNGRSDCLFVKDTSKPQKKYLIDLLSKQGIKKTLLYRQYTTFPQMKE